MADTPLIILVGTMSGTAELVADHVLRKLTSDGIAAKIVRMEKAALAMFATRKHFLICSSTTGRGDVPDNARPFYESLVTERPVLTDVTYGVIGLGDSRFKRTFNGGPARFDAIFAELGARRIGERMKHDCRTNVAPEAMALAWLEEWLVSYRETAGEHA